MDGASNKHLQLQNVKINMDEKAWAIIKAILAKGDRVELIPVKDGIKIMHIKREEVKNYGMDQRKRKST